MNSVRITREFHFEMAHALWNYDGACKNIHGHSYKLFVTVSGNPITGETNPKFGMVMDFKDLKGLVKSNIVDKLDHSLIVYTKTDGESLNHLRQMYEKVFVYDFQPTCENLVIHMAELLIKQLPPDIHLYSLKLFETATSYAEWYASDNQ
ncbi:6-pyruvoyl tetrahydropterin synthase family protein [Bacteroidota bacterium]